MINFHSVTTLEQLSNYINTLHQTLVEQPLRSKSFEIMFDNECWFHEINEELTRLKLSNPPETILTPDMMQGLRQLLEKREKIVAGKALDYPQDPLNRNNMLFLGIAQVLRKIYGIHPYRLLMPSLVNFYNLIADSDLDDTTQVRDFIRSEDGKTAIYIRECFEYAEHSETLTFYHTTFMDKCIFITHSVVPSVDLLPALLGDADAAYIQHGLRLFYLHKAENSCTEILINPTQLDKLSETLSLDPANPTLSYQDLHKLVSFIGHSHRYSALKPLSEEEKRRVINHSDYTKDWYDVLDSLNQLKYRCINFGSILNGVVSGLRSGGVGEIWKKIRLKTEAYARMDANQISLQQDILPSTAKDRNEIKEKYEKTYTYYDRNAELDSSLALINFISWLQTLSNEDRNALLSYDAVTSAVSALMRIPQESFIVALSTPLTLDQATALLTKSSSKPIYARYTNQLFIIARFPEIGYQLCLKSDVIEPNNLYIEIIDDTSFSYKVLDAKSKVCEGTMTLSQLETGSITAPLTFEKLQFLKYNILNVTSDRDHTATNYWKEAQDFAAHCEKFDTIAGNYDAHLSPLPLKKVLTLHLLINAISPERNNNPDCVQSVANALEEAVKNSPKLYELKPSSTQDLSQDDSINATYTALREMCFRVRQRFDEAISFADYEVNVLRDSCYQLDLANIAHLLPTSRSLEIVLKDAPYNSIVTALKLFNVQLFAGLDWGNTFSHLSSEQVASLCAIFCQEMLPIYNAIVQMNDKEQLTEEDKKLLNQHVDSIDLASYIKVILSEPFNYQLKFGLRKEIFQCVKNKLPAIFNSLKELLSYCDTVPTPCRTIYLSDQIADLVTSSDELEQAFGYYEKMVTSDPSTDLIGIAPLLQTSQHVAAILKKAPYDSIVNALKLFNIQLLAALDWRITFSHLSLEEIASLRAIFCQEMIPLVLHPIYKAIVQMNDKEQLTEEDKKSLSQHVDTIDLASYIKVLLSEPFSYQLKFGLRKEIFQCVKNKLPANFDSLKDLLSYCDTVPTPYRTIYLSDQIADLVTSSDELEQAFGYYEKMVTSDPSADLIGIAPLLQTSQQVEKILTKASYDSIVTVLKLFNVQLLAALDWRNTFSHLYQEKFASLCNIFCQEMMPSTLKPIYNTIVQWKQRYWLLPDEKKSLGQHVETLDIAPHVKLILSDPFNYQIDFEVKKEIFEAVKNKLPVSFKSIKEILSYCASAPLPVKAKFLGFYRQQIYSLIISFDDLKHALTYYLDPKNYWQHDSQKIEATERTQLLTFFRDQIVLWITSFDELHQALAYYFNDEDKVTILTQFIEKNNLPLDDIKLVCSKTGMRKIFIEKSIDYENILNTINSFSFPELMAYFMELNWFDGDEILFMKSINSKHFQSVTSDELYELIEDRLTSWRKKIKLVCGLIQQIPAQHFLQLTKDKPAIIELLIQKAGNLYEIYESNFSKLLFDNIPEALQHYIQTCLTTPQMILDYLGKSGGLFLERGLRHLNSQTLLKVFTEVSDIKTLFNFVKKKGYLDLKVDSCENLNILIKGKAQTPQDFVYFLEGERKGDSWYDEYNYYGKNIFPAFHETIKTIIKNSIHKISLQEQFTREFLGYFGHSIPNENNIKLLKIIQKLEQKTQKLIINNLQDSQLTKLLKFDSCVNLLSFLQLFFNSPILSKCLTHIIAQKTFSELIKSDGQLSNVLNFTPPQLLLKVLENVNLLKLITSQDAMDKVLRKLKTESGKLLSNEAYTYFYVTIAPNMAKIQGLNAPLLEHEERLQLTEGMPEIGELYATSQEVGEEKQKLPTTIMNKSAFFSGTGVDTKQAPGDKMPINLRRSM